MVTSSDAGRARGMCAGVDLPVRSEVRRRISPQAGRALEILGHAIEYLTDEYVQRNATISADDGQLQAVQLLMGINRQIYFDCPQVPSLADRWRALLQARAA